MASLVLSSTFLNNGVQVQFCHQTPMITTKYTTKKHLKNINCSSKNSGVTTALMVASTLAAPLAGLAADINNCNIPTPPQPQLMETQTRMQSNFTNSVILDAPNLTAVIAEGPSLGGWQKIENLSDQVVKVTAEFALVVHNEKAGSDLRLVKVLEGEQQVVKGLNYSLVIQAQEPGKRPDNFKVQVYEFQNEWKLTDFTPLLT